MDTDTYNRLAGLISSMPCSTPEEVLRRQVLRHTLDRDYFHGLSEACWEEARILARELKDRAGGFVLSLVPLVPITEDIIKGYLPKPKPVEPAKESPKPESK